MKDLAIYDLGRVGYQECLEFQQQLHGRVAANEGTPNSLILVEHPPVITLGKNADTKHLLLDEARLQAQGVGLCRTDRGGEATAHMPGQLVAYPILRLADFALTPKKYVTLLETTVIEVLSHFGVKAATDPSYPGVWVGMRKICAIGLRIMDRTTLHGIALNVDPSFELFNMIVPCGIVGRGVTSLVREAECPASLQMVAEVLVHSLLKSLNCQRVKPKPEARLPSLTQPSMIGPLECSNDREPINLGISKGDVHG